MRGFIIWLGFVSVMMLACARGGFSLRREGFGVRRQSHERQTMPRDYTRVGNDLFADYAHVMLGIGIGAAVLALVIGTLSLVRR